MNFVKNILKLHAENLINIYV